MLVGSQAAHLSLEDMPQVMEQSGDIAAAIAAKIVDPQTLERRIDMIEAVDPEVRRVAKGWLATFSRRGERGR